MTGPGRWTGVSYQRLAAGEDILRYAPLGAQGALPEIFAQEASLYARSPERGLYVVTGGRVDAAGLCSNRWGYRVDWNALSLPAGRASHGPHWRPDRLIARGGHRAQSVLALTHPEQRGYFHWLFDVLPRYAMARDSGHAFDVVYLDQALPFQRETWALMQDSHPVIDAAQHLRLAARRLLVPAAPSVSGVMPRWVCEWLRDTFLQLPVAGEPGARMGRRLYVSRQQAGSGRVANEAEVVSALEPLGFEVVRAENLHFLTQAALFADAECVVGPHGAGLSNIVFAPSGCRVIELFADRHINVCYWTLACQRRQPYAFLVCPPVPRASAGRPDMVVDIAALRRLAERPISPYPSDLFPEAS